MPFVQDNKNGATAPLGSIKDRIKNFEFMKDSGTTSPRARSPIQHFTNNDSARMLRRTGTSLERDGSERRQMRRSERREAELRKENEILAMKEKEKFITPRGNEFLGNLRTEKNVCPPQATDREVPRAAPRMTPHVTPREKAKPPEPALRRRRNETKEIWHSSERNIHGPSHEHNSVSVENQPSTQATKSSSNVEIEMNSSEEPADISSEELEETKLPKKESEKGQLKKGDGNGVEEGDEKEDEDVDDEIEGKDEEQEEEEIVEEEEVGEQEDEAKEKSEEVEDNDEERTEEEQEESSKETNDGGKSEGTEEEEAAFEPPKQERTSPVNEQSKERRDKIANYASIQVMSRQDQRLEDCCKNNNGVAHHNSTHSNDKKNKETEVLTKRHDASREMKTKQHQRQSSVSGNESGEVKPSRRRKEKRSTQAENTSAASNDTKTKQHRRHGSASGSDLRNVREETSLKTPAEKSDSTAENTKKDESHGTLVKTKSIRKGTRRSGSRNSLKSDPVPDLKESGKAVSKSKQAAKKEDGENNTSSGRNSRKTSYTENEIFEQLGNENELLLASKQLNHYSNTILGVDVESEGTSSPEQHEEPHSKKAFVCAIHEEPCKYYCQDCERLICSECAMRWGDCHEHYYLRVKDAWKKYREEMTKILQAARSGVSRIQQDILENSKERDSFKLKVESTIKRINSFFDEHVQALEKRRTNFLVTVEEIMKFREIGINQEIDNLQNNLAETNSTINIAGRVYGASTMMEFLQVCKQLTNRLLELGHKKIKLNITENIDIDFISEPTLFEEIEKLGQLKKHRDSSATKMYSNGDDFNNRNFNGVKVPAGELPRNKTEIRPNVGDPRKVEENEQDSMDSVVGTSTENLSESTSAKDTNDFPREQMLNNAEHAFPQSGSIKLSTKIDQHTSVNQGRHALIHENEEPVKMKSKEEHESEMKFTQYTHLAKNPDDEIKQAITEDQNLKSAQSSLKHIAEHQIADCPCGLTDNVNQRSGLASDAARVPKAEIQVKQTPPGQQHARRHSMDDVLGIRSKKEEIQRRLGYLSRYRPPKSVAQFLDEGERYFSSGEAEQRRRKQEYYKVRFNDRAYYSNPSDSSELEEMRGYDLEERPVKHKIRRHRTMPMIRPISERRELNSPWTLDVFRYHGKIHFSRNSLKATGKAFGWNAVVGCQGFSQGKHSWKVRVTKWTAVGVCYKDDHVDNPSWGAGNKWTWDSADMCYSPRLGVCESPVGEWIDGDVIALELDCDNSVLIVHNLRTSETDKLYGFKEPVYPYFYLSVFRSISVIEIDGIQVGS